MEAPPSTTLSTAKTVPVLKTVFLRSQIRLLSAVLQPSSTWRDDEYHDDDALIPSNPSLTPLPDRTITTVLTALNAHLQSHNLAAYPPQTQRHIAEQIDALYWSDITAQGLNPPDADEVVVGKDADLSTQEGFESLPDDYGELSFLPQSQAGEGGWVHAEEAARYWALRARLQAAMAEQRRQRTRLEGYRRLRKLLEPFEDLKADVRPSLVGFGGDGELGAELERLKGLLGTVVARIGEVGTERVGGVRMEESMVGLEGGGRERDRLRDVMDVL